MRAHQVVELAPTVKRLLALRHRIEAVALEDFAFESAMKALILALRLRMVGRAVAELYPQSHQPNPQLGEAFAPAHAPGRAIVCSNALRQSVLAKSAHQC